MQRFQEQKDVLALVTVDRTVLFRQSGFDLSHRFIWGVMSPVTTHSRAFTPKLKCAERPLRLRSSLCQGPPPCINNKIDNLDRPVYKW